MALHYDFKNIKNFETLCYIEFDLEEFDNLPDEDKWDTGNMSGWTRVRPESKHFDPEVNDGKGYIIRLNPVTDVLIWICGAVGINEITEKNAIEFYNRLNVYERLRGSWLIDNKLTQQDVYDHIGLHTNSGRMTRRQFLARLFKDGEYWKREGDLEEKSITQVNLDYYRSIPLTPLGGR